MLLGRLWPLCVNAPCPIVRQSSSRSSLSLLSGVLPCAFSPYFLCGGFSTVFAPAGLLQHRGEQSSGFLLVGFLDPFNVFNSSTITLATQSQLT
jgi:hypothetical protein